MVFPRSAIRRKADGPPWKTPVGATFWSIGMPAAPS
jgi:hypothetical protein